MSLTVTDLENKIKQQAGELAIAGLQIQSLIADNAALKKQLAEQEPAPNRAARRRAK